MEVPVAQQQVGPTPVRQVSTPAPVSPDAWGASGFLAGNKLGTGIAANEIEKADRRSVDEAVRSYREAATSAFYGADGEGDTPLRYTVGEAFYEKSALKRQSLKEQREQLSSRLVGAQREMAAGAFDDIDFQFGRQVEQVEGGVRRQMYQGTYEANQDAILSGVRAQASDPAQITVRPDGSVDAGFLDRSLAEVVGEVYRYSEEHADLIGIPIEDWRRIETEGRSRQFVGEAMDAVLASGDDIKASAFLKQYGVILEPAERGRAQGRVDRANEIGTFQRFTDVSMARYPVITTGSREEAESVAESMGVEYLPPTEQMEAAVKRWRDGAKERGMSPAAIDDGAAYVRRRYAEEINAQAQAQDNRTVELMDALDDLDGDLLALQKLRGSEWVTLTQAQQGAIASRAQDFTARDVSMAMKDLLLESRTDPDGFAKRPAWEILGMLPLDDAQTVFKWQEDVQKPGRTLRTPMRIVADAILDANERGDNLSEAQELSLYDQMDAYILGATEGDKPIDPVDVRREVNRLLGVVESNTISADTRVLDLIDLPSREQVRARYNMIPLTERTALRDALIMAGDVSVLQSVEEQERVIADAWDDLSGGEP